MDKKQRTVLRVIRLMEDCSGSSLTLMIDSRPEDANLIKQNIDFFETA